MLVDIKILSPLVLYYLKMLIKLQLILQSLSCFAGVVLFVELILAFGSASEFYL